MMQLYNKLSAKERAALIEKAGKRRITLSFYKYHQIENTSLFRDHLYLMWEKSFESFSLLIKLWN